MATLYRWREFVTTPKTLIFPHLELIGRDYEPPIVVGAGEIRMNSPIEFAFTLKGTPADIPYALTAVSRHRDNPYDAQARPRLIGVDAAGVRWAGGYTVPRLDPSASAWTFYGEIDSLVTDDESTTVSQEAGAELLFLLRVGDPMAIHLARYVRTDPTSEDFRREHVMQVLGSRIHFAYEDSTSTLSIVASHSPELSAPYAENWIGEPLRILFGQLIFPRLVARNFGNGRASVWVRPSPGLNRGGPWVALWREHGETRDSDAFWLGYRQLLSLIAQARSKDGSPNFESNKVTRLYEECIQAAGGSRWVWALTFASSIEALTKMLIPTDSKPAQAAVETIADEAKEITPLIEHIETFSCADRLKRIAVGALQRSPEVTTTHALRGLEAAGVITPKQFAAWRSIRNAVMHGSLVSPYSTEEEDAQLLALPTMMHALTWEVLRRSSVAVA